MLRRAARAAAAFSTAAGAGVASAPTLLTGDDSMLLRALTPAGATLAINAGWTNSRQRIWLSFPHEGLQEASVVVEGSLWRLLRGRSSCKYSVRASGRGVRVCSDGDVKLEVTLPPNKPQQQQLFSELSGSSGNGSSGGDDSSSSSSNNNGSGGTASKCPELALRLTSPTTVTVEIEDTSAASVEALEQLSSLHPFAADIIMAGAGPAATASPITIDSGSRLRLFPNVRTSGGNCRKASAICASGSVPGRAQHQFTLRYSGGWINHLLRLLAESGLSSTDNKHANGTTTCNSAEIGVSTIQLAHSALRWHMENGTVCFTRADLFVNQQVRLASYGSYTFTGDGRRIEAVLAVPAVTLRQIQVLAHALTDDQEGIVLKAELTTPEPPPRGYYLNAPTAEEAGTNPRATTKAASAGQSVDWLTAVQWEDAATQVAALTARGMAAQLKKSTYGANSLLTNVALAVVHETTAAPRRLPPAPLIPDLDRPD